VGKFVSSDANTDHYCKLFQNWKKHKFYFQRFKGQNYYDSFKIFMVYLKSNYSMCLERWSSFFSYKIWE